MKLTQDQTRYWRRALAVHLGSEFVNLLSDDDIVVFAEMVRDGINRDMAELDTPKPAARRENKKRQSLVGDVMKRLESE